MLQDHFKQTTRTHSLSIWVSLFIFLEDNLACSLSPKELWKSHLNCFQPISLLTRNAAKEP